MNLGIGACRLLLCTHKCDDAAEIQKYRRSCLAKSWFLSFSFIKTRHFQSENFVRVFHCLFSKSGYKLLLCLLIYWPLRSYGLFSNYIKPRVHFFLEIFNWFQIETIAHWKDFIFVFLATALGSSASVTETVMTNESYTKFEHVKCSQLPLLFIKPTIFSER